MIGSPQLDHPYAFASRTRSRPPDLLILGASKRRTDRWSQGADRRHGMAGLNHQGHNTAADDVPRDKE